MERRTVDVGLERARLTGLGGWLVLPLLGMLIAPIRFLAAVPQITESFDYWALWDSLQRMAIITEVSFNVISGIFPAYMLILFFQKRRSFPGVFVNFMIFIAAFAVFYAIIMHEAFDVLLVGAERREFIREIIRAATQPVVAALIWIPYMRKSRRVAYTFVK